MYEILRKIISAASLNKFYFAIHIRVFRDAHTFIGLLVTFK